MKARLLAAVLATAPLAACVAPVGPVEVTRFHLPDTSMLGKGSISVEPVQGSDASTGEFRTYAAAVARQLVLIGYAEATAGSSSPQIAELRVTRQASQPQRRSPVSVGLGGATGTYGSGVGLGIGFDLSGPSPEQVTTEMSVTIRDSVSRQSLWEGRARFTVRASSPLADTQLGAARLAEALFQGFPGQSGETVEVR